MSRGVPSMGWLDGSSESWKRFTAFLDVDGKKEVEAFRSGTHADSDGFRGPTSTDQRVASDVVRVVAIRHGMANHNTYAGMGSIVAEDAELNDCGQAQADRVGEFFRQTGVLHELDLVVVSPFTRTLQTASRLLGLNVGVADPDDETRTQRAERAEYIAHALEGTRHGPLPIIVQPLCAERTDVLSHVGRGNRGSTAEELAVNNPELCRAFDLTPLAQYCAERRIGCRVDGKRGKWWHHGPHSQETEGSFKRRCTSFRKWLGRLNCVLPDSITRVPNECKPDEEQHLTDSGCCGTAVDEKTSSDAPRFKEHTASRIDSKGTVRNVLVVTHGGLMEEAFGFRPNAPNCGFRVFDVDASGACVRFVDRELVHGPAADPAFQVYSVHRRPRPEDGHILFEVELGIVGESFTHLVRESELRTNIYDVVRQMLPSTEYERYGLANKFPGWVRINTDSADPAMYIQDHAAHLRPVDVGPHVSQI